MPQPEKTLNPRVSWIVGEERHGYDQVIRDADNNPICTVLVAGWDKKSARDHAHLISAAPELLAVLIEIVEFCDDPNGSERKESLAIGLARMLPAARATIAKARP